MQLQLSIVTVRYGYGKIYCRPIYLLVVLHNRLSLSSSDLTKMTPVLPGSASFEMTVATTQA